MSETIDELETELEKQKDSTLTASKFQELMDTLDVDEGAQELALGILKEEGLQAVQVQELGDMKFLATTGGEGGGSRTSSVYNSLISQWQTKLRDHRHGNPQQRSSQSLLRLQAFWKLGHSQNCSFYPRLASSVRSTRRHPCTRQVFVQGQLANAAAEELRYQKVATEAFAKDFLIQVRRSVLLHRSHLRHEGLVEGWCFYPCVGKTLFPTCLAPHDCSGRAV